MKKLFKIVFVLGAIFFLFYCIASDNYVEANKINSVETVSFPSIKGETYIPVEFTSYYEVDLGGTVKWMVSPSENAYFNNRKDTGNPIGIRFTRPGEYTLSCSNGERGAMISITVHK